MVTASRKVGRSLLAAWNAAKITLLFVAVMGLGWWVHEVDVKHNADVCAAVTQVRNAVQPFTKLTPVPKPDGSAIQDQRIKNIKASNKGKLKASRVLDPGLRC